MAKESFVETVNNDPNLLGIDFNCAGADSVVTSGLHPAYRGEAVGVEIKFATWDENKHLVDDRSANSYRGCAYNTLGKCTKGIGNFACPVSSVVSMEDFRDRVQSLRGLKKGNPNKVK
jgi:hypothetical protein